MAETITIIGGRKHNWNRKIRGQKLVRLTVPTTELTLAGVLQWCEGANIKPSAIFGCVGLE